MNFKHWHRQTTSFIYSFSLQEKIFQNACEVHAVRDTKAISSSPNSMYVTMYLNYMHVDTGIYPASQLRWSPGQRSKR